MPDKGHSNGSKFCDQEKVVQTYPFHKFWTRKLKNQIYNCSCLQGVQRPRKRDFEKCMGRVRKTPLSRVSVKTSNNQIKVTTGITNMNNRLTWELRYNSSLFAYGQTGSGKSWSVFGYGVNKGMFAEVSVGKYMIIILKCELNLWNDAMANILPNSNESQASCRCLRSSCSKRSRQKKLRAGSSLRSSSACWRSTTRYNSCVKFIRIQYLYEEIWWLNWIFNVMKRWQVIFLSPPLLERRNHRWRFASIRKKDFTVSGVPSKFHGLPQKIHYSISLFQRTARKRCWWTTMMKSTHAWKRGR